MAQTGGYARLSATTSRTARAEAKTMTTKPGSTYPAPPIDITATTQKTRASNTVTLTTTSTIQIAGRRIRRSMRDQPERERAISWSVR